MASRCRCVTIPCHSEQTLISCSLQGSDFYTVYVRRTSEPFAAIGGQPNDHHAKRLAEEIRFVKFSSITWTHDSKGFFYQVGLEYFHLGSDPEGALSSDFRAESLMVLQRRIKLAQKPQTIRMLCSITTELELHNVRTFHIWLYRCSLD